MHVYWRKSVFRLIVGIILCLFATGVGIVQSGEAGLLPRVLFGDGPTVCWPDVFIERTMPETMPVSVPVYRVQSLPARKELLLRLFRVLPIAPSRANTAALTRLARASESSLTRGLSEFAPIERTIGGWIVQVWPDGQFSANHSSRNDAARDAHAPPEEQVREVADAFLTSIKPLLPREVRFSAIRPASSSIYGIDDNVIHSYCVSYTAELSGFHAGGVSIEVAAGSKIVAIRSNLSHVVIDRMAPILSRQEVMRKLRAHEAQLGNGLPTKSTVYLDKMEIVYWTMIYRVGCKEEEQRMSHLMPMFIISGEAVSMDKEAHPDHRRGPWKAYLEAVKPELLEALPAPLP